MVIIYATIIYYSRTNCKLTQHCKTLDSILSLPAADDPWMENGDLVTLASNLDGAASGQWNAHQVFKPQDDNER